MRKLVFDLEFVGDKLLCAGYHYGMGATSIETHINPFLKRMLVDPEVIKVCHSKADWRWLLENGYELAGPLEDTMVKAWVLDENTPLTLDFCAMRYAGIKMDKRIKQVANEPMFRCDDGTYVHLLEAPIEQVMAYNKEDVAATVALNNRLDAKLDEQGWAGYYEAEQRPFTEVLLRMERNGLPINLAKADKLRQELEPELERQAKELDRVLGYPLRKNDGGPGYGSSKLLRQVLFSKVWSEPAVWEHKLDLRKPTIVKTLAEKHQIPKSQVTQDMVNDRIFLLSENWKPKGMQV